MRLKDRNEEFKDVNVLVIDDEIGIIDTIKALLKRESYNVIGTTDSAEGLQMIKSEKIDILLLDYYLENATGEDIVKEIRETNKDLFIILQTGYSGQKPPLEMMKRLDINGYYDKGEPLDKLLLWVNAGSKVQEHKKKKNYLIDGLNKIIDTTQDLITFQNQKVLLNEILEGLKLLFSFENAFINIEHLLSNSIISNSIGRFLKEKNNYDKDLLRESKEKLIICEKDNNIAIPIIYNHKWIGEIYIENCKLNDEDKILIENYIKQSIIAILLMVFLNEINQ